jgi:site-specific recombinase XerD
VTAFIEQQRAGQRAATTINRRLNALQHFFEYLTTERQMLNQATQHWHTGSTRKRAMSVCP